MLFSGLRCFLSVFRGYLIIGSTPNLHNEEDIRHNNPLTTTTTTHTHTKKKVGDGHCVCGSVLMAGRRKASLIHLAKAIYVRITLPEQVRQERCCTSNYLIREAATLGGGRRVRWGSKGGEVGKLDHWLGEAMGPAVVPGHSHYHCN